MFLITSLLQVKTFRFFMIWTAFWDFLEGESYANDVVLTQLWKNAQILCIKMHYFFFKVA